MKKIFLSLILVLMLLPTALVFSACGKDKGYDLNNLKTDFYAIENENLKIVDNNVVFDYSQYEKFNDVISIKYPYVELTSYNVVATNILSFATEVIEPCSNNDATDDVKLKNKIKTDLDVLKESISNINAYTNVLIEAVAISNEADLQNEICLIKLEALLEAYDKMFESARNFNKTLSDLYFKNILNDGNPNIYLKVNGDYATNKDNFLVDVVINKLNARIAYQKSNLSECFAEQFVNGCLAEDILGNRISISSVNSNYLNALKQIDVEINEITAVEKANANKEEFYKVCVEAYNVIEAIENDRPKFVSAANQVNYNVVKVNEVKTAGQKMCLSIVDNYTDLIANYNSTLVEMLSIVGE